MTGDIYLEAAKKNLDDANSGSTGNYDYELRAVANALIGIGFVLVSIYHEVKGLNDGQWKRHRDS